MSSIIVVDSRVRDSEVLLARLDDDVQVVYLDPGADGIEQTLRALATARNLDALHIVSHGAQGALYLGSTLLTESSLGDYGAKLAQIGASLSPEGDILLYGCNVGAGTAGQRFIETLARYTGADVAASVDFTGAAVLGANWVLEAATGPVEASAPFEGAALDVYAYALPAAGTLDTTFDGDGKVTTAIGTATDTAYSLALQPDGKVVVAGSASVGSTNFALARYNTDGGLDTTFDGDGKLTTDFGPTDLAFSVALQSDGKIVAAGRSGSDFALARYLSDGSLDTTFSGDGKLTTAPTDVARSLALQPDGRIVVAGDSFNGSNYDFALVRYNTDGSLDTTFDGDGIVTTAFASSHDLAYSVALQADGRIVVAGYRESGGDRDFALARYNTDGSLDTTFDGDGKVTTAIGTSFDEAWSLVLQSDGRIVVAGYAFTTSTSHDFALARYNTDGSLDTTFDGDGKLTTSLAPSSDYATSVALQSDGKIVVAGESWNGADYDFAITRFNTDGSLDTTFDGDGRLTIAVGSGTDAANAVAIQSDGNIVAAGLAFNGSNNDFALIRLIGTSLATPTLSIAPLDADNPEGNSGATPFTFTVTRADDLSDTTTVDWAVSASGTSPAADAADFGGVFPSGTLSFLPTETSQTITVNVSGDTLYESGGAAENFTVTLSNPSGGATIASATADGQIQNDDPAPTAGSLDPTFGGDGIVTTPMGAGNDEAYSLALQPDGRIVATGWSFNGDNLDFALARYNTDGSLDTTFDADGKLTTAFALGDDEAYDVALQPDGRIVVAGYTFGANYDFAAARYNTDGSLDTTFDGDGRLITAIGTSHDYANELVLQPDGRIVVAGHSYNGSNYDFALVRYNTNGTLDTTFDGDGKVTTAFGTGDDFAFGLAVQGDGKIVAAGRSLTGATADFALARYNTDGSLDSTFDGDGKLTTAIGPNDDGVVSVLVQPDGKIIVAGWTFDGFDYDFVLARYNTDGSLDTTFDADGKVIDAFGSGNDEAFSLALQADGRIVVAGYSSNGNNDDFLLARYNTDGSLDTTFDGDGSVRIAIGGGDDYAWPVAIQDDGNIIVAGYSHNGSNNDFALVRVIGASLATPTLSIAPLDADIPEGNSGATPFTFTVTRADDLSGTTTVDWAVSPSGTSPPANAADFGGVFPSGTLTFLPTETTQTITVNVSGDTLYESAGVAEHFTVTLSNASGDALITTATAGGQIQNDDALTVPAGGSLDPAFGDSGIVMTAIGTADDYASSLALQPDGKIVVAGYGYSGSSYDFAVARYNTDGSFDSSFDSDGKAITSIGSSTDRAYGVALQSDGRIVVAGWSYNGLNFDFALARYHTDGSLDTSFGSGGKVTTAIGSNEDIAFAVAVQPDGRIVVTGSSFAGFGQDFALVRYNTDGSLDATFGSGGKVITPIGVSADTASSIALQPDGKIVVAGQSLIGLTFDFALARYNTDGSLDTTFGNGGEVTTAIGSGEDAVGGVTLQPDGKIVVAGWGFNGSNSDFALARYNTDGSLDSTFDGDGKLTTGFGSGDDLAHAIALQPDGKIVVAGESWNGADYDFAITRYNTDGSLDTTFDGDGRLTIAVGSGTDAANAVAIQSDGNIVAAGISSADFALVRVLSGTASNLVGGPGPDTLEGGSGNDTLSGLDGNDMLDAGDGDDTLIGGAGDDTLIGGNDTDTADYSAAPGPVTVDLGNGTATGADGNDVLVSIENAIGSDFGDTLIGNDGANVLDGRGGADILTGGNGNDLYHVDEDGDVVTEVPNEISLALGPDASFGQAVLDGFIDSVIASVNYSLENVAFVENIALSGSATTATGNALDNAITGNALNNALTGLAGNDTIDGEAGLDTALFSASGGASPLTRTTTGYTVSGPDGNDTLTGIERLQFSDKKLALDLGTGEAAGNTVRIIGAAFDTPYINPNFVRIGLNLFDSGQNSMLQVCELAIGTPFFQSLTGSPSNEAFVNLVFQNVVGFAPSDAQRAPFVGMLQGSGGSMTQAQLLELAANHPLNAININLTGLQDSGVEFA